MPTTEEWAYLAGIIDGEGSIALVQRKAGTTWRAERGKYCYSRPDNSYQCYVTISNTDEKMVDWIAYTFQGSIWFTRRREGNRKIQYVISWQANDSVRWILENTIHFMLTKHDVAEAILEFLSTPKVEKDLREIIYKEFKEMKVNIYNTGRVQL
jgi:hypothetical protein